MTYTLDTSNNRFIYGGVCVFSILKPKNVIFIVLFIFLVAMAVISYYFKLQIVKSAIVIVITIFVVYFILDIYLKKVFDILEEQKKTITDKFILLNSITDGVYGIDKTNKCIFINKAALNMLELTKSHILHKSYHILFKNYKEIDLLIHDVFENRQISQLDTFFIKKNGEELYVHITIAPSGKDNVIVIFKDMTFFKEYEKVLMNRLDKEIEKNKHKDILLQQQTSQAVVGQMIGNISHQWRQPLNAITTSVSGLKVKQEYGMLIPKDIIEVNDDVMKSINFMSQTIDDFRNFFKSDLIKQKFKIFDVFDQILHFFKASFEHNHITIKHDIDHSVEYLGVKSLLSQVILNILSNAKDALVDSQTYNKVICIRYYQQYDYTIIEIKDNAGGIEEYLGDKIFDCYFTTKQEKGTGIGLYMSKEIIERHFNGIISYENVLDTDGIGAQFRIKMQNNTYI